MRRSFLLAVLALASASAAAQSVFINEIHYDNLGTDAGEFVEVAGPPGTDLTGWSVVLYNGTGGAVYTTSPLSGILPTSCTGLGVAVVNYPVNGVQNGAPDGVALINNLNVPVQFLSYEGTFTAVGGAATGVLSVDIGVAEAGTEAVGQSLRLSGTGSTYPAFTWNAPAAATPGACNTGQSGVVPAETLYGITGNPAGVSLVSFSSATPGTVTTIGALSGIVAGHSVKAIDFRPANAQLYALSTNATNGYQLYTVNLTTAALTPVGAGGTVATNFPTFVSMDFNPAADRLRVVTETNNSYRINPNDGTLAATDTSLAFAAGDPNAATTPTTVGVAYDRNDNNAGTPTTLFAYDFNSDVLARVGSVDGTPTSPNTGLLTTIGNSGVITDDQGIGLDIGAAGIAFVNYSFFLPTIEKSKGADKARVPSGVPGTQLFSTINLATGALTLVGSFQAGIDMLDIAVQLPAVAASADLSITKTDGSANEVPGTPVTYTIVASNAGPSAVVGGNVSDTFAAPLAGCTWSCVGAGGGTCTAAGAGNINDTVNLPLAATVTYSATCSTPASATGNLANTATVAVPAGTTDPTPGNNSATDTDVLVPSADLTVVLSDSPDPVTAGTNLTYTAVMTNNGPSDATGANIALPLPGTTTLVSVTATGATCTQPAVGANGTVTCTWAGATVPGAGGARTMTVVALVPANTAQGATLNTGAAVASSTADPVPVNNTATAGTAVIAAANLSVTLTDAPDPVNAGGSVTYVATLTNGGPSDAQGANTTLVMPTGTTFVSTAFSAGGSCTSPAVGGNGNIVCTWAGATVAGAGNARSMTVVVGVPAATPNATVLTATATAASTTTDPVPGNNQVEATTAVSASADLSITLIDSPDPVTAGTNLSYTATLTNGGPSDAQGATITLPLPAGTSFVSVTSVGGSCNAASPVVCSWPGATIPTSTRSMTVVAFVAPSQVAALSATATASSSTTDPVPGNNAATAGTTVVVSADLSITLADAPDPVVAGTNLTYTAIVTNAGPSDATGVTITLPLPTGTSLVSGSVTGGGACTGSPVVCSVTGSIAPGISRTATIVLGVAPSVMSGTVLSATATVAAASPDPNPGNNSASTTTNVITSADLLIGLTTSATQAFINVPVTFTATSLNQGPSDAQNVVITLTLTPDFRYSSHTATGATCTTPQVGTTGAIVCTWAGATAPGVTRTLTVVAYSNVEGATAVNASTSSATPDPVPNNNLSSVTVQVGYLVEEIPALNGLGLMLLGLMLGLAGFVALRRQG